MKPNLMDNSPKTNAKMINREDLVRDLRELGVKKGDLLNLKVSLKSIGWIEGGANMLVEALLEAIGETGTIVADAFINVYPLPLSKENAKKISDQKSPSYAGALANAMLKHPKMFRSSHPVQKFVAIGAEAEELMGNHTPDSYAYDVLRVMAEKGGKNLKIGKDSKVVGVGTTHVAIGLLGFKQKRKPLGTNYRNKKGEIVTFKLNWPGGCSEGFNNFLPLYKEGGSILAEGKIGNAETKTTSMKRTLEIEMEKLSEDPTFFFCKNPACVGCRLTWEFSSGNIFSVNFHRLLNKFKPLLFKRK